MNSDDGHNDGNDPAMVQGASAAGERWQQGEEHSKIRNQCYEPADSADEVEVLDTQPPEYDRGNDPAHHTDSKVRQKETPHHLGDVTDGAVRRQTMLLGKETHRADVNILFDASMK